MASNNNVEFRVGVFVLLGIIILGGSLYWLQGYKLEANSRMVRVKFDDVGTLSIGDKVTVSGVHRGKVNTFNLVDDGVVVELLLSKEVKLYQDARFAIRNMGVMGERFIAISPGVDSLPFDTTGIAPGASDTGIPQIMGLLGETITELKGLLGTFRENAETHSTLDKINKTLANMERASSSLAGLMERNEDRFEKSSENISVATAELRRLVIDNAAGIDSTVSRFGRAAVGMEQLVLNLDTIAVSVRTFTDALAGADGTMQLLAEDRELYDDLKKTVDNVDQLVSDIRANPRKYINLKVELF